jgi:hypothetical protein
MYLKTHRQLGEWREYSDNLPVLIHPARLFYHAIP